MENFSLTVLRNSAFGMAAQFIVKILSFGFSVLVVRHLGAEIFGQYAAVLAFGTLFAFVADLGLGVYVVREVARSRSVPDGSARVNGIYGNVLVLRFLLSLLAAISVIIAAWLTGRPLLMLGAIALNSLVFILYSVQGTSEAVLAGFERLDISAGVKVLHQLVFVVIGAIVILLNFGYYGLIIANLLGVAIMTYICWRSVNHLKIYPRQVMAHTWPALLRASLPFGMISFALGLSYRFDSVLLNIFRSDIETGYYSAVYNLVFSAVLLSNVFNTALYPSLTRQTADSPHKIPDICQRVFRYLMLLSLPIALGSWALADQLIPFLYTVDYLPAVPAFQIVIWVVPLMFASEFLGYIVIITDHERLAARAVIISTGINITLNLLLVPRFGFLAAAVMTVVTEMVLVGQYMWLLRKLTRQFDWRQVLLRPVLATLLMGALALLLRSYVSLLPNIAISAAAYLIFLVILGIIGRSELRFIRSLLAPAMTTQ